MKNFEGPLGQKKACAFFKGREGTLWDIFIIGGQRGEGQTGKKAVFFQGRGKGVRVLYYTKRGKGRARAKKGLEKVKG